MEMHVLDQSPYFVCGSLCASPNKSAAFCTFQELKKYNIGNRYRYCFDKGESFRWEALEAEKLPTRSQAKQAAIRCLEEQTNAPVLEGAEYKIGTIRTMRSSAKRLSYWKQMVGPPGFEPGTDGL
jgi:hypothetical protein